MWTEIWTRLVAVSLISTHGDDWGIGITITLYGVVIPATPLPVNREILNDLRNNSTQP